MTIQILTATMMDLVVVVAGVVVAADVAGPGDAAVGAAVEVIAIPTPTKSTVWPDRLGAIASSPLL